MEKRCRAFPTEYQHEFTKKKLAKLEPIRPVEDWAAEEAKVANRSRNNKNGISDDGSSSSTKDELINKLVLDRYKTAYQFFYGKDLSADISKKRQNEEEIDLGNELILYLKNLYYKPHTEDTSRLPYTTARVCGYASPETLQGQLSVYQDTYGRTGGNVILQNVQKIIAMKRRQAIRDKLRANLGERL